MGNKVDKTKLLAGKILDFCDQLDDHDYDDLNEVDLEDYLTLQKMARKLAEIVLESGPSE